MFKNAYRHAFVMLLASYSYLNAWFSGLFRIYQLPQAYVAIFISMLAVTFLVWEGNHWLEKGIRRYKKHDLKQLFYFFLTSLALTAVVCILVVIVYGKWIRHEPAPVLDISYRLALLYGFRINVFLHIINALIFYFTEFQNKKLEAEELKRINAQAELQMIKHQINPHFLFNNLNVLSSLIISHNANANKFIEQFAQVYRYILKNQTKELVDLKSELAFIEPYIFILKTRFGDGLKLNIQIPEQYHNRYIVPVVLQMLIENAMKHNMIDAKRPLTIDLFVDLSGQSLTVKNNKYLKKLDEVSTKIGLKNIQKRFELITGRAVLIRDLENEFLVEIPLIQLESEEPARMPHWVKSMELSD